AVGSSTARGAGVRLGVAVHDLTVGGVDLLHLRLGLGRASVDVRVTLLGQAAIGRLHLVVRGAGFESQYPVGVLDQCFSPFPSSVGAKEASRFLRTDTYLAHTPE